VGTSLYALTNSNLKGKESKAYYDSILKNLKSLNLDTTSYSNGKNEVVKEYGEWEYEIHKETSSPFNVYFNGPHTFAPILCRNIGIIDTIYRYRLLYEIYKLDWFEKYRTDLFKIMQIIGGTEIIYVADNACDKLCDYLEGMALEDVPYEEIKEKMIIEMGNPVTDYSLLDYDKLDYRNINEFFLDDFKDLKSKKNNNAE